MSLRAWACLWRPWGWRGGCADEAGGAARIIKSHQGWLITMPLFLTEADVQELLTMEKALERVEASFLAQARGGTINRSRERIFQSRCSLHYLAAALPEERWLGMKIYTIAPAAWRFLVLLYDGESGQLLAMLEADHLGRLRTGAASGVATKHMARAGAALVGLIGSGRQARTQLEAVAKVRALAATGSAGAQTRKSRSSSRAASRSGRSPWQATSINRPWRGEREGSFSFGENEGIP